MRFGRRSSGSCESAVCQSVFENSVIEMSVSMSVNKSLVQKLAVAGGVASLAVCAGSAS